MDFYDKQAHQMRNVPGLSLADGTFIDNWVERARAGDRRYVTQQVRRRRDANSAKAHEMGDRINALQDELVAVRKKAERNEVPWTDLAKLQRRLGRERIGLEKLLESLQATEATNQAMESDPTAWLSGFYSRHSALRDRRPNLASDLADDQRKRGITPPS